MMLYVYKEFFACLDGFVKVNLTTLHKGRLFGLNFWLFVLFCFFLVAVAFEDLGGCWLSAFCFWFLLLALGFWFLALWGNMLNQERINLDRKQWQAESKKQPRKEAIQKCNQHQSTIKFAPLFGKAFVSVPWGDCWHPKCRSRQLWGGQWVSKRREPDIAKCSKVQQRSWDIMSNQ